MTRLALTCLTYRKLKSQSGASFALALVLLIVCVAVSSILIGASTSVSGSAAQFKQGEQRYYTVASAARFVNDCLANGSVSVEQTKTTALPGESVTYSDCNVTGQPVLELATRLWLYGDSDDTDNADRWGVLGSGSYPQTLLGGSRDVDLDFTVKLKKDNSEENALKVKAKGDLNSDGRLNLTLRNVYADGQNVEEGGQINKQFFMRVVLEPSIEVLPTEVVREESKTVETKKAAVVWNVVDASEARASES